MIIKKQLLLIPLLLLALDINAQQKMPVATINPFTYGKQVIAVQDNFVNLFRNIPLLINNPKDIVFLKYMYIGTVQTIKDAKKYLSEDLYSGASIIGFSSHQNANGETYDIEIVSSKIQAPQKSIDGLITALTKNIHEGDKVYQIQFKLNHIKQHYNVFVNPKTKQILAENNQFILPRPAKVN